jgi:hypothetical protein
MVIKLYKVLTDEIFLDSFSGNNMEHIWFML